MRWLYLVILLVAVTFAVAEDDEVGEFFGLEDTESDSEEDLVDLEGDIDVALTPIHEVRIEEVDDEQPGLNRQRNRDIRRFSRKLKNYMRRKGMTEISQVPTRRFPSHLRRAHRLHQRGNGRMNGHHMYRKVMKKVHQNIHAGGQDLAVCIKVERRAEPKSKLIESLPDDLRPLFQQLYTDKWSRFAECCDRSDIDGKRQCIAGVHAESTNRMCTILSTADITTLPTHFQNKAHCCQSDAGNRQICLQNGRRSNRKHDLSPEERLTHTCRRIQMAPAAPRHEDSNPNGRWRQIFAERRRDMMECCNKQSLTEKLDCSFDVHLERFDRICDGEENLRPNNCRSRKQELCCTINDEDRVSCFMNRTFRQSVAVAGVELPVDVAGEEKMMGDAPMSHDLTPGGHRGNRRGNRRRGRNERQQCCSAGRQARQEMPNDGKAMAMASRECGYRADAYLEEFTGNLPRFCRRVFSRCCSKSSGEQSGRRRQPGRRRNRKRKMTSTQAPPTPQQEEVKETEEEVVPS